VSESSKFPATSWESDWVKLDRAFLGDFAAFGARGPFIAATALAREFRPAKEADVRRVMLVRMLGEYVQALDNYGLLLLGIRTRSQRSILQTFLDHRTEQVVSVVRDLVDKVIKPSGLAGLIGLPETEWDEEWSSHMKVALAIGEKLRTFSDRENVWRRFYAKSKHGFVVVRRPDLFSGVYEQKRDGPPWEGDSVVFVTAHGVPQGQPDASYVDVGAMPVDAPSVNLLLNRCDALADATSFLAEGINRRLSREAF
jgi:hypothetical protein